MLPGLHRVRARSARGLTEYWYAWRGGPRILTARASSAPALAAEVARQAPAALRLWEQERSPVPDRRFLGGLIAAFRAEQTAMQASGQIAPRTLGDLNRALDVVHEDLGRMETLALEARRARSVLLDWRDRYRDHPRTADARMAALAAVLKWAAQRGEIARSPLDNWPRLYRANRADVIWEPHHLDLLRPHCPEPFWRAVQFAALTGLRPGDLVAITRSAITPRALVWQTGKSRGRRTVVIPRDPALDQFLAELPDSDAVTILVSSTNLPWTVSGLQTAMQRAKREAEALWRKTANDPQAISPLRPLRLYDLRGTGATNRILAGMTLDDTAIIMGWDRARVEAIAMRYVTADAVAEGMLTRIAGNKSKPPAVKGL